MNDSLSRVSGANIGHRYLITWCRIFRWFAKERRGVFLGQWSGFDTYFLRLDTFCVRFTFSNKDGLSFNEIRVQSLSAR